MKLGIALSGGGVKAAAHIGVLQALEENNIKVDMVGGTSAGSMVAVLYALGYTPKEMLKLFQYFAKMILKGSPTYVHPDGKKTLSIRVGGFLSGETIYTATKEAASYKGKTKLIELTIPIAIPSVDIDLGEKFVFTNKESKEKTYITKATIATAVRASSSYPGVFAPCLYDNHKFVDGGILDNVPADEVRKLGADKVIAVKFALNRTGKTKGVAGVATKAIDIMFDKRSSDEVASADLVLDIQTKSTNVFDIKKITQCYEYGYEQTIAKMNEIKKLVNPKEEEEK